MLETDSPVYNRPQKIKAKSKKMRQNEAIGKAKDAIKNKKAKKTKEKDSERHQKRRKTPKKAKDAEKAKDAKKAKDAEKAKDAKRQIISTARNKESEYTKRKMPSEPIKIK